jgi:flagellin-specific chaperone FliS
MTSLDFAGEGSSIAENLLRVYLFAIGRIQSSTLERRDTGLVEARRALETLRDGWAGASPTEVPAERPHRLHVRG